MDLDYFSCFSETKKKGLGEESWIIIFIYEVYTRTLLSKKWGFDLIKAKWTQEVHLQTRYVTS